MYLKGKSWAPDRSGYNLIQCDRKNQDYHGFKLKVGYVYGWDLQGWFVTPMIHDNSRRAGLNARLLMWRLHPARGWCTVWEQSNTTRAIMAFTGERKPTKPAPRFGDVNPLTQAPYVILEGE